jgi:preprotein translocase subunit YajC
MIECAPLIFTGVCKMSLNSLFISNAYAQTAAPASEGGIVQFLPLFVLIIVFYFLILRPQQKRAKEQKSMIAAMQKGDEVVAAGGLLGRVSKVDENYVSVEVAEGVIIHVQKSAVQTVLPKGTIKAI